MRLTILYIEKVDFEQSKSHALMALMCFQSSQFESRINSNGQLLTLKEQDRSTWNSELINRGSIHLAKSTESGQICEYHLQASIAACHAFASSYEATDWESILQLYNSLMLISNSLVVKLNRIVAIMK